MACNLTRQKMKVLLIDLGHDGSDRFFRFRVDHLLSTEFHILCHSTYFSDNFLLSTPYICKKSVLLYFHNICWELLTFFLFCFITRNITRLISTYQCTSSTADIARRNSVEDVARWKQTEREAWMRRRGVFVTKAATWMTWASVSFAQKWLVEMTFYFYPLRTFQSLISLDKLVIIIIWQVLIPSSFLFGKSRYSR